MTFSILLTSDWLSWKEKYSDFWFGYTALLTKKGGKAWGVFKKGGEGNFFNAFGPPPSQKMGAFTLLAFGSFDGVKPSSPPSGVRGQTREGEEGLKVAGSACPKAVYRKEEASETGSRRLSVKT